MFENITKFFKKIIKKQSSSSSSKDTAKERLHLVLMQDRANVSADFLDLMRQEIIDVIKKYIEVDESAIDVRLTNKENEDGTNGAPALYANIPIISIKEDAKKEEGKLAKEKKNEVTKKQTNSIEASKNDTNKNEGKNSIEAENDKVNTEKIEENVLEDNSKAEHKEISTTIEKKQEDTIIESTENVKTDKK